MLSERSSSVGRPAVAAAAGVMRDGTFRWKFTRVNVESYVGSTRCASRPGYLGPRSARHLAPPASQPIREAIAPFDRDAELPPTVRLSRPSRWTQSLAGGAVPPPCH